MREFKFRAWQKDVMDNGPYMVKDCSAWTIEELNQGGAIDVMQSTGLIDMNAREVYEGDILRVTNPFTKISTIKSVWWNGETARFNGIPTSQTNVFEVIGNIYENPELLK